MAMPSALRDDIEMTREVKAAAEAATISRIAPADDRRERGLPNLRC
jgi:hypothetical protein